MVLPVPLPLFHWRRIRNLDKEKQTLAASLSKQQKEGKRRKIERMRERDGRRRETRRMEDRGREAEWDGSRRGDSRSGTYPQPPIISPCIPPPPPPPHPAPIPL